MGCADVCSVTWYQYSTRIMSIRDHHPEPDAALFGVNAANRRWAAAGTGIASAVTALGLYLWTLAPGLTSADGGDFLIAASHLGVPHPSGYPVWTMLGWCATRLPFRDPALATNLLSAVCAAVAVGGVGVLGLLTSIGLGASRREAHVLGFGSAMLAAVSRPIWSQAVITEVYSLHLAWAVSLLLVLYAWIRQPAWRWGFAVSVGVLSLGMSVHHLSLALVPLPVLVLIMLRPNEWPEQLAGTMLAALLILRGWSELSGDSGIITLFHRLLVTGFVAAVVVLVVRRRPRAWFAAGRPVLVLLLGLLPHLYLPLAAAQNPSLCWSCPTTGARFFHLTNLTTYWGSHTAAVYRVAGRALDVSLPEWALGMPEPMGQGSGLMRWIFAEAAGWVTLPVVCLAVVALGWAVRGSADQRRWIVILGLAVVCSGFVLPMAVGFDAALERQKVLRTYLGFPAAAMALLGAAGAARLSVAVRRRFGHRWWWVYPAVVVAAVVTAAWVNEPWCSRRDNNLTNVLMHELLDPLPEDPIVLAVSDTTFFGARAAVEVSSRVDSSGFLRSDPAVITPARMSDLPYLEELDRNFGAGREVDADGTPQAGPPIGLPTAADRSRVIAEVRAEGGAITPFEIGSRLAHQLVEANIDTRTIVVEMPVVYPWAVDRLSPDGLWLRLEPEPIGELAGEVVDRDLDLWDRVLTDFETHPRWMGDLDLRQSVVDLRMGGVHVYRHRGMCRAAVRAAHQALRAAPESTKANAVLAETLFRCGDPESAARVAVAAVARDPWNPVLQRTLAVMTVGGPGP